MGKESDWEVRVITTMVNKKNGPVFGELATIIEVSDEAAGEFVKVRQQYDGIEPGTVSIDKEEWPLIREAIDSAIGQLRKHK